MREGGREGREGRGGGEKRERKRERERERERERKRILYAVTSRVIYIHVHVISFNTCSHETFRVFSLQFFFTCIVSGLKTLYL